MDNYCSQCGQRLHMSALEQQRESMSRNPFMSLGSGVAFNGAFNQGGLFGGKIPFTPLREFAQAATSMQRLELAAIEREYQTKWERIKINLTTKEMTEERERMRADGRL